MPLSITHRRDVNGDLDKVSKARSWEHLTAAHSYSASSRPAGTPRWALGLMSSRRSFIKIDEGQQVGEGEGTLEGIAQKPRWSKDIGPLKMANRLPKLRGKLEEPV